MHPTSEGRFDNPGSSRRWRARTPASSDVLFLNHYRVGVIAAASSGRRLSKPGWGHESRYYRAQRWAYLETPQA